jgi:SAM-dependent methyltransferase
MCGLSLVEAKMFLRDRIQRFVKRNSVIRKFLRKIKHSLVTPNHKQIFSDIYKNRRWGTDNKSEFYSGDGSDEEYSIPYVRVISDFIEQNGVRTVVDLGCGDFRVGKRIIQLNKIKYIGVDVVEDLIRYNSETSKEGDIQFLYADIVRDTLPEGDLCLLRQVLQHLSNRDIKTILRKCKKYKHLIVTEHQPIHLTDAPNIDKEPNGSIRYYSGSGVYLDKPPYNKRIKELLNVFPENYPDSKISTSEVFL